jgi:hypothetical protein
VSEHSRFRYCLKNKRKSSLQGIEDINPENEKNGVHVLLLAVESQKVVA